MLRFWAYENYDYAFGVFAVQEEVCTYAVAEFVRVRRAAAGAIRFEASGEDADARSCSFARGEYVAVSRGFADGSSDHTWGRDDGGDSCAAVGGAAGDEAVVCER